jgi:hypothetical protein
MRTIRVFVDTSTVNRVLRIKEKRDKDAKWEEDREYLNRIVEQYVEGGVVRLIVNPTVRMEIEATKDPRTRARLLREFEKCRFTDYNITRFPFSFPATFPTREQSKTLKEVLKDIPHFDGKIFADAVCNSQVEVLLTTDREHLANDTFRRRIQRKGLDKNIKICTPKELFEHLQNVS